MSKTKEPVDTWVSFYKTDVFVYDVRESHVATKIVQRSIPKYFDSYLLAVDRKSTIPIP